MRYNIWMLHQRWKSLHQFEDLVSPTHYTHTHVTTFSLNTNIHVFAFSAVGHHEDLSCCNPLPSPHDGSGLHPHHPLAWNRCCKFEEIVCDLAMKICDQRQTDANISHPILFAETNHFTIDILLDVTWKFGIHNSPHGTYCFGNFCLETSGIVSIGSRHLLERCCCSH